MCNVCKYERVAAKKWKKYEDTCYRCVYISFARATIHLVFVRTQNTRLAYIVLFIFQNRRFRNLSTKRHTWLTYTKSFIRLWWRWWWWWASYTCGFRKLHNYFLSSLLFLSIRSYFHSSFDDTKLSASYLRRLRFNSFEENK